GLNGNTPALGTTGFDVWTDSAAPWGQAATIRARAQAFLTSVVDYFPWHAFTTLSEPAFTDRDLPAGAPSHLLDRPPTTPLERSVASVNVDGQRSGGGFPRRNDGGAGPRSL